MISTGNPKNTEVIDLEDSNVECEDLEDYPMEVDNAFGASLASTPIICGGYFHTSGFDASGHSSDKCFKYKEGKWQNFSTMIEGRYSAVGIVYNNALHIFGGRDYQNHDQLELGLGSAELQSSEIIKEDGSSSEGPHLPVPIYGHAIASINSTVSILSGGITTQLLNGERC